MVLSLLLSVLFFPRINGHYFNGVGVVCRFSFHARIISKTCLRGILAGLHDFMGFYFQIFMESLYPCTFYRCYHYVVLTGGWVFWNTNTRRSNEPMPSDDRYVFGRFKTLGPLWFFISALTPKCKIVLYKIVLCQK